MKLDISDLKKLYGPLLFLIEEKEQELEQKKEPEKEPIEAEPEESIPEEVVIPQELLRGSAVDWKLKPNSTLAFVLDGQEFKNRELTGFLKTAIEKAGVPLNQVGFGVMNSQESAWNFSELPVTNVWVFGISVSNDTQSFEINDKQLFLHDSLASLTQDQSKTDLLIHQLSNRN